MPQLPRRLLWAEETKNGFQAGVVVEETPALYYVYSCAANLGWHMVAVSVYPEDVASAYEVSPSALVVPTPVTPALAEWLDDAVLNATCTPSAS